MSGEAMDASRLRALAFVVLAQEAGAGVLGRPCVCLLRRHSSQGALTAALCLREVFFTGVFPHALAADDEKDDKEKEEAEDGEVEPEAPGAIALDCIRCNCTTNTQTQPLALTCVSRVMMTRRRMTRNPRRMSRSCSRFLSLNS
jgi:hypothetical protein